MCVAERSPDDPSVVNRFLNYVDLPSIDQGVKGVPCWLWNGGNSRGGNVYSQKSLYGTFNPGGLITGGIRAHVFMAWLCGLIPEDIPIRVPSGMNLDHLCNNSLCIQPKHLQLISAKANQEKRILGVSYPEEKILTQRPPSLVPFETDSRILWTPDN